MDQTKMTNGQKYAIAETKLTTGLTWHVTALICEEFSKK